MRVALSVMAAFAFATQAWSDTVLLNTGQSLEGKVSRPNPNSVVLEMDGGTLTFQSEEIARIEPNAKKGPYVNPLAMQHEQEFVKQTGLNAAQREEVLTLMEPLKSETASERNAARQALVRKAQQMDVFRFLAASLPSFSGLFVPQVLEVLAQLDSVKARPLLRQSAQNADPAIRIAAIELLAKTGGTAESAFVARGAIDADKGVQSAALSVLARMGERQATPVFLEALRSNTARVRNTASASLQAVWKDANPPGAEASAEAWEAFWKARAGQVKAAIEPGSLKGLVEMEEGKAVQYHNE